MGGRHLLRQGARESVGVQHQKFEVGAGNRNLGRYGTSERVVGQIHPLNLLEPVMTMQEEFENTENSGIWCSRGLTMRGG